MNGTEKKLLVLGIAIFSVCAFFIIPQALAQQVPSLNIPPTNAFDHIYTQNGSINSLNFSMPLNFQGENGLTVQSSNKTHMVFIYPPSSTGNTHEGSYNTTQANNVNKDVGSYKLNFINGTNNPINIIDSPSKNQVNITISSSGGGGGVTSLNALSGALNIVGTTGNVTVSSAGSTITLNTAYNIVTTAGSAQTISKQLTLNNGLVMGSNINLGTNFLINSGHQIGLPTNSGTIMLTNTTVNFIQASSLSASATKSNSLVMMGLGSSCKITPIYSGIVYMKIQTTFGSTGGAYETYELNYGTSTAPINGVAVTGTTIGSSKISFTAATTNPTNSTASVGGIASLTPNTSYWFDLALKSSSSSVYVRPNNIDCTAFEIP